MSLESSLKKLCDDVDGANAAFICGMDGIIIDSTKKDCEGLAADCISLIKPIKKYCPKELILYFKEEICVVKIVGSGILCLTMNNDGNVARAKMEMNRGGDRWD